MKLNETLYTQLTDRQLPLEKRLDLTEQYWNFNSRQMIFDWLCGLVINRKKSGLDSIEIVHRVWNQLKNCLKNLNKEPITIKPLFIKALIEAIGNETDYLNNPAVECCLLIGNYSKDLDYKYEQIFELLRVAMTNHQDNQQLLTMILNKYWATIRVQGNINKVFVDLSKQLFSSLLNIRSIHLSLSSLIDEILKHVIFHRTWSTAYRDYIESVSSEKTLSCPVSPLFTTLEALVISGNANVINFLPLILRHCIYVTDPEKVSNVFEVLIRLNSWLEQIQNDNLYVDSVCQLLQVLDEKHLIDQLLNDPSAEERVTTWMKDMLFKRCCGYKTENFASLCVTCLYLHPTLIEANLSQLTKTFIGSEECLSIFLIGYIDLYARMRSLSKLTKRLTTAFDRSLMLPENVLKHYRKCISECTHTLVNEIWLSLIDQLDMSTIHLLIVQLISTLLDGYRLFDLNISHVTLVEQNQLKYDRTLDKLRQHIDESMLTSPNPSHRICILQCYLSLGWFSLCLLSFLPSVPPVVDLYNHNGLLLSHDQWLLLESDVHLQSILFSLACQRLYRALTTNENDIDPKLIESLLGLSSFKVFDELEPFFDFLPKAKQYKLIKVLIRQIIESSSADHTWFLSNETRLQLVVQAAVEYAIENNADDDSRAVKRRKISFEESNDHFYEYLQTKSCAVDGKIVSLFCTIHFGVVKTMGILISIGWLALNTSPVSLESMQVLIDIIRCSENLPISFVSQIVDFTFKINNEKMAHQILTIVSNNSNYQISLKNKANKLLNEMKSNEDHQNIRLLEKHLLLFNYSRSLTSSNDVCSIIDRLISSSSKSSISYSSLDTRYILAMIILNSVASYDRYFKYLEQTWKSVVMDINETNLKPVVTAYAQSWEHLFKSSSTIDDIDALVKCLNDQYELISKVIHSMKQEQFQQWIDSSVENIKIPLEDKDDDINNCRRTFQLLQTLSHCPLNKSMNLYLMTTLNSVVIKCGSILIHLPIAFARYSEVADFILTFANVILVTKKAQLRSQAALSLLQCCLHLPANILFLQHSNICKLLSLLIKHHAVTLCKHVPTVETTIKLLLQSIITQAKANQQKEEVLIEAARDITKLSDHLIEQCRDDFRSTIAYVLIDYVHLLSKGVFLSSTLKKTLHGAAFELFRICGERIEQYSGQMPTAERELLKQLQQQFKQYHMFKGVI